MPDRFGLPTQEEIAAGFDKSFALGSGLNARRKVLAAPAEVGEAIRSGARVADRVVGATAAGAKNFFTGLSGGEAPPSSAVTALPAFHTIPARTQNAVANATGTAAKEDRGFKPTSGSSAKPGDEVYPGKVEQFIPRDNGTGWDNGASNIRFNAPTGAVAEAAQSVSPNVGLLPPEFHSQIAELLDAAKPLINSKGIMDRLRGRQLLGARDRLIQGATQIAGAGIAGANAQTNAYGAQAQMLGAQTGAYRASNEVPLAMLSSATQKYGVDVGADTSRGNAALAADSSRYHTDETNATARHGIDMRTALDLPQAQRQQMVNDAIVGNRMDDAGDIATVGSRAPVPKVTPWVSDGMGRMVRSRHDGKTEMLQTDPKTGVHKIVVVDPDETDKNMKNIVKNAAKQ